MVGRGQMERCTQTARSFKSKGRLLKHNLFETEKEKVLSVTAYNFEEIGGRTVVRAREKFNYDMTDQQYNAVIEGWKSALDLVRQTSEKALSVFKRLTTG